jgi:hypothetical protein
VTGVRDCWIVCDSCEDASAGGGSAFVTVAAAREDSLAQGWHHSSGRDICDACWEQGQR